MGTVGRWGGKGGGAVLWGFFFAVKTLSTVSIQLHRIWVGNQSYQCPKCCLWKYAPPPPNILGTQQNCFVSIFFIIFTRFYPLLSGEILRKQNLGLRKVFQTLPLFSITTTLCAKCGLQVSHVSVCLYVYVDTSSNRLISSAAGADRGGEATNPALLWVSEFFRLQHPSDGASSGWRQRHLLRLQWPRPWRQRGVSRKEANGSMRLDRALGQD